MSTIIDYTMLLSSFLVRSSILDPRQSNLRQMSPSSVYALVQLLVVRKLYWSGVIVVASVHDYVPRTGDQEVPVKPGFVFFILPADNNPSSLSHPTSPSSSIHRLDTISSFSVFCRRSSVYCSCLGALPPRVVRTCISSSLVFVQEFPVAAAHLLLASTINRFRVVDVPAFGKQCCSLHSRFIVVSFSVPLRRRRRPLVPPPPRPFLRSWLAEPRRGGGRGGFFFRCNWDSCIRRGTWVVRG